MNIFCKFMLSIFFICNISAEGLSLPQEEDNLYKVRVMYGWGFFNTLEDLVIKGDHDKFDKVSEIGISLERYINKNLWDKDVELALQLGYIRHDEGESNNFINQYNIGLKAYWTQFPWSKKVRTKFFTTGGLSYTDEILSIEIADDDDVSKLLFYLEFGLELNLGDITTIESLEPFYLGGGISHRSGIFGTFNGVHGGSNYLMLFIEMEF